MTFSGEEPRYLRDCEHNLLKSARHRLRMPVLRRHGYCLPARKNDPFNPLDSTDSRFTYCFCNDWNGCNTAGHTQVSLPLLGLISGFVSLLLWRFLWDCAACWLRWECWQECKVCMLGQVQHQDISRAYCTLVLNMGDEVNVNSYICRLLWINCMCASLWNAISKMSTGTCIQCACFLNGVKFKLSIQHVTLNLVCSLIVMILPYCVKVEIKAVSYTHLTLPTMAVV